MELSAEEDELVENIAQIVSVKTLKCAVLPRQHSFAGWRAKQKTADIRKLRGVSELSSSNAISSGELAFLEMTGTTETTLENATASVLLVGTLATGVETACVERRTLTRRTDVRVTRQREIIQSVGLNPGHLDGKGLFRKQLCEVAT